jgi:hypothetical protein
MPGVRVAQDGQSGEWQSVETRMTPSFARKALARERTEAVRWADSEAAADRAPFAPLPERRRYDAFAP